MMTGDSKGTLAELYHKGFGYCYRNPRTDGWKVWVGVGEDKMGLATHKIVPEGGAVTKRCYKAIRIKRVTP